MTQFDRSKNSIGAAGNRLTEGPEFLFFFSSLLVDANDHRQEQQARLIFLER